MTEESTVQEAPVESNDQVTGVDTGSKASRNIPLTQIVEPGFRLREAQRGTQEYQDLMNDIRRRGVIQSILVRPVVKNGVEKFELITGTQRFNASLDLGLTTIPATIKEMTDDESQEAQIVENIHRVKQKPSQIATMLQKMMNHDPALTPTSLARKISRSVSYVNNILSITKLPEDMQELVNENKIPLLSAVKLSSLSKYPDEQRALLDDAMNQTVEEFVPAVAARKRELDKAAKQGQDGAEPTFTPVPKVRKKDLLLNELRLIEEGNDSELTTYLTSQNIELSDAGRKVLAEALRWTTRLDAVSIAEGQVKFDENQKLKAERAAKLKAEREEKRKKAELDKAMGA